MKSVWKFPLKAEVLQEVQMPCGAEVLSVQMQPSEGLVYGKICVWALCDTETLDKENREFVIIGTGGHLPPYSLEYLGTIQTQDGEFVFHVFEHVIG